jgi:glycosyltransferase involved in cell wall biosynthesis
MRIAMLASNFIRIPPESPLIPTGRSGAAERIVYDITEELVRRGHDVTLFASGDSKTSAKLISVTPNGTALDPNIGIARHEHYELFLIGKAYQMAKEGKFDLIHSHFDSKTGCIAPLVSTPTVVTLHSPLTRILPPLSNFKNAQYYVSISNSQRQSELDLQYIDTVYHGIRLTDYSVGEGKGGYLLFLGRIVPQKGLEDAIMVSERLGIPLKIVGEPPEASREYFQKEIQPHIKGAVEMQQHYLAKPTLHKLLGDAAAVLFPVKWEEPFGLVMIESMATGTPIVAYGRGAVPEVIKDGITGYIVEQEKSVAGLTDATEKILHQSEDARIVMRQNCRRHVEERFTVEHMVDGYEAVYKKICK